MKINEIHFDINQVLRDQPDLRYDKDTNCLQGKLNLYSNTKYEVIDNFSVHIDLSPFPKSFPIIKETDGRIPVEDDRHINNDGTCCLTTNSIEKILLKTKINSLSKFINDIVVPFFANQSYFEIENTFQSEAYSHEIPGIFESYKDILKTDNLFVIIRLLYQRGISNMKIRPNDPCYCGKPKKIKKCHLKPYNEFKLIDKNIVERDFKLLYYYYKEEINKKIAESKKNENLG